MLRYALNAAISMGAGAPAHELLVAKSIFTLGIQGIQAHKEASFSTSPPESYLGHTARLLLSKPHHLREVPSRANFLLALLRYFD